MLMYRSRSLQQSGSHAGAAEEKEAVSDQELSAVPTIWRDQVIPLLHLLSLFMAKQMRVLMCQGGGNQCQVGCGPRDLRPVVE